MGGRQDGNERRLPVAKHRHARNRRSHTPVCALRPPFRRRGAATGIRHPRTSGNIRRDRKPPHRPAKQTQQREAGGHLLLQRSRTERADSGRHGGRPVAPQPAGQNEARGLPHREPACIGRGTGAAHPASGSRVQCLCQRCQSRISEKRRPRTDFGAEVRRMDGRSDTARTYDGGQGTRRRVPGLLYLYRTRRAGAAPCGLGQCRAAAAAGRGCGRRRFRHRARHGCRAASRLYRLLPLGPVRLRRRRDDPFRHARLAGVHAPQAGRIVRQRLARRAGGRDAAPLCLLDR